MEKICSKILLVKAGSKIVTIDQHCDICEFELLQDLEVEVTCQEYYKVEKQGILPSKGGTDVDDCGPKD
jgi:hypothetical protein